ncbi:hypothetical protein BH09ACT1_BH09ACT1_11570 [soil metagenome]
MHPYVRPLIRPIILTWALGREDSLFMVPRPSDEPTASVEGPRPVRVLLVGDSVITGWGVRSFELAYPGQIARGLSRLTGRGVSVEMVVHQSIRVLTQLVNDVDANSYDAVVVIAGSAEAVSLESEDRWSSAMSAMITALNDRFPSAPVIVSGILRLGSAPGFQSPLGKMADTHGRILNDISRELCGDHPQASFVPTEDPAENVELDRYRSADQYRIWSMPIVAQLSRALV